MACPAPPSDVVRPTVEGFRELALALTYMHPETRFGVIVQLGDQTWQSSCTKETTILPLVYEIARSVPKPATQRRVPCLSLLA